jgi:hypothetical protein
MEHWWDDTDRGKLSMEHWWDDTDRDESNYCKTNPCPGATLSTANPT